MIRAAIYIRVSTEEQHLHGLSLETQRDALTDYAKKHDMQIVDIYADEGITARKRLDKRLQFQRLLSDVKADKIDIILVTKLDRWFRNIRDYHNTQDILEKHRCNWKTIFENYDTSTASGRLHINIMLSVNQDECDRTSERIKAVFAHKVENGEVTSHKYPRGYKVEGKKLVIDPDTVQQARDAFDWMEQTGSISRTHAKFCAKYGSYHRRNFTKMLQNERYIGRYKGVDSFCPAIISIEQFERVQRAIERNAAGHKNDNRYTYIFSRLLRCADCGSTYVGTNCQKVRGGEKYRYKFYKCCKRSQAKACGNKYPVPETVIEKYLLKNVQTELQAHLIRYSVTQAEVQKKNNAATIATLKKKRDKLKDLYLDDLIDKETYKRDYEALQGQIAELSQDLPQDDGKARIKAAEAVLRQDFADVYATLSEDERRQLWLSVIDYIEIGHSRNDITVHYL